MNLGRQSSTRALLAHGGCYKVAVSDCGCHDNCMDKIWWNETWTGWPVGPEYTEQALIERGLAAFSRLAYTNPQRCRNIL